MFNFRGKEYPYIDLPPNNTRINERRVEVSLGYAYLERYKGQEVLEVGNVMRHYKPKGIYTHDVLDLYETNPNFPEIINQDILTWCPTKRYKATLSISTLEHTSNPILAIANILSYSDHVFITVPFGYAKSYQVFEAYPDLFFMQRINNEANEWREATRDEVAGTKYNEPFRFANAIMILER